MSDLLSIGASGVRAYQSALTTTSENIANAGTVGYSRRATQLAEVTSTASASATSQGSVNGYGVVVTGVGRASDPFRVGEVRTTGADLARSHSAIAWMDRIEGALGGYQIASRMTGFFNAAQTLAADPASTAPRAAMIEAADSLAVAFQGTSRLLGAAAADLDGTAQSAVRDLGQIAGALAEVNSALGRVTPNSAGQAQLLDDRDRLLESMSALTDITVTTDGFGRAEVRAGGANGPLLVSGNQSALVSYARTGGAVAFVVTFNGTTNTAQPQAGALAGIAEGAQRVHAAIESVDAMAVEFGNAVNAVQAAGRDLDGLHGAPLFTVGTGAADLAIATRDPRAIAAADVGAGPRDSANLARFAELRTDGAHEGRLTALVSDNASALAARRAVAEAQGSIRDHAVAARDAVSGVNLDEEAVSLLRFQQAYQASTRVIQVARETLQSILDLR